MALDVVLVRGSGQEYEGCLLLTSEVLFVVSISEDTQQQAFPVTEIDCAQDSDQKHLLTVQLKQPRVACDVEVHFRPQSSCRQLPDKSGHRLTLVAPGGWEPRMMVAVGSGEVVHWGRVLVGKTHPDVHASPAQEPSRCEREFLPGPQALWITQAAGTIGLGAGVDRMGQ